MRKKPNFHFKPYLEQANSVIEEAPDLWSFDLSKKVFEAMGFEEWIKTDSQLILVHDAGMSVAIKENGKALLTLFSWNMNLPENNVCAHFSSLATQNGPRIRVYHFDVDSVYEITKAIKEGSHLYNGFEIKNWDVFTLKSIIEAFSISFSNDDSFLSHKKSLECFYEKSSNLALKKISKLYLESAEELFFKNKVSGINNVISTTISELYPDLLMNNYGPDEKRKMVLNGLGVFLNEEHSTSLNFLESDFKEESVYWTPPLLLSLEALKRFFAPSDELQPLEYKGYAQLVKKVDLIFNELSCLEIKDVLCHENWLQQQLISGLLNNPVCLQMIRVVLSASEKKDFHLAQELFTSDLFNFNHFFQDKKEYHQVFNNNSTYKPSKNFEWLKKQLDLFLIESSSYLIKTKQDLDVLSDCIKNLEECVDVNSRSLKIITEELQKIISEKTILNVIPPACSRQIKRF